MCTQVFLSPSCLSHFSSHRHAQFTHWTRLVCPEVLLWVSCKMVDVHAGSSDASGGGLFLSMLSPSVCCYRSYPMDCNRSVSHTAESVRSSNGKRRYGSFVLYSVVRTTSGATGRVSFRGHRSRYPSTKREISLKYFVTVQKEHRKFFSLPRLCTNKEVRGEEV